MLRTQSKIRPRWFVQRLLKAYNQSLYVAVTRSRVQLFLMESGDQEIAPVQKSLRDDPTVPLIDVTRPHEVDVSFAAIEQKSCAYPLQV